MGIVLRTTATALGSVVIHCLRQKMTRVPKNAIRCCRTNCSRTPLAVKRFVLSAQMPRTADKRPQRFQGWMTDSVRNSSNGSKSRSRCSSECCSRIQNVAMRQSIVFRTVWPRLRRVRSFRAASLARSMPPVSNTSSFRSCRSTSLATESSRTPCNTSQRMRSVTARRWRSSSVFSQSVCGFPVPWK